jgi:hypothetical protein
MRFQHILVIVGNNGNTRYLVDTHWDGTEILARGLNNLINTIDAYHSIYHKGEI